MRTELNQYIYAAAKLTAAGYQDLTRELEKILPEKELEHFHIMVAFFRLQLYPDLARAMKEELALAMYADLNAGKGKHV